MKSVLCFLNGHDLADKLDNNYLAKLLEDIKDFNTSKKIYAINIIF